MVAATRAIMHPATPYRIVLLFTVVFWQTAV
jgi:hypothetical protein